MLNVTCNQFTIFFMTKASVLERSPSQGQALNEKEGAKERKEYSLS